MKPTLSPALYALRKLHADLGGQVVANKVAGERLADDMRHVEAVIKLLDPSFNVASIAPKRRNKPSVYFQKGKCFTHVLDVLRDAPTPMTANEIVDTLLRGWGTEPTVAARKSLFGAVNGSLKNHHGKTVECVSGHARPRRWSIHPGLVPLPLSSSGD